MKPSFRSTVTGSVIAPVSTGKCAGSGRADVGSEPGVGRNDARDAQHAESAKPPRLLDQVRARMRRLGMAIRSEDAYVGWIRRFILAHGKRHPRELVEREVEAFLTDPAVRGQVAASMQDQALLGWLFMDREVLQRALPWTDGIRRAQWSKRSPPVAVLGRPARRCGMVSRMSGSAPDYEPPASAAGLSA